MIHELAIWKLVLGGFLVAGLSYLLGFFTAAMCCAARLSDEENDRLRAHILKNYPGGKDE